MVISAKSKKLASNLMMNITKIGETLKSEKFMIIFAKSELKSENYHEFFRFEHFSHFHNIYLQVGR